MVDNLGCQMGKDTFVVYSDALGIAFVKEHPFPFKRLVKTRWGGETEITYHFCMDVALLDKKVNIEYDGDPTHYSEKGKQKDAVRDAYLKAQGWTIYRIRFDRNKSGREANKFFVRSLTQLPEILSQNSRSNDSRSEESFCNLAESKQHRMAKIRRNSL